MLFHSFAIDALKRHIGSYNKHPRQNGGLSQDKGCIYARTKCFVWIHEAKSRTYYEINFSCTLAFPWDCLLHTIKGLS